MYEFDNKIFFIPSLCKKNFLKVRNGFGLKMKSRVLVVKYSLRFKVCVKASERYEEYLKDSLS